MRAVMSLSDRIVVLNLGAKLAEGTPQEVAENPEVIDRLSRRFQPADGGGGGAMSDVLLRVEGLEAGYDDVQVVWGISLEVACGGDDHAARRQRRRQDHDPARDRRLLRPSAGRVVFEGEDVTRLSPMPRPRAGLVLVPEGRQLFSDMTVEENLEMGAYSPRARTQYSRQLDMVYTLFPRLKERCRQNAGTFSGGEQQMLAIARGLMSVPDILMIDEFSLGLAPVVVQQLVEPLKTLKESGVTVLLVEQNLHLALAL